MFSTLIRGHCWRGCLVGRDDRRLRSLHNCINLVLSVGFRSLWLFYRARRALNMGAAKCELGSKAQGLDGGEDLADLGRWSHAKSSKCVH